jgi:hypothetical protein
MTDKIRAAGILTRYTKTAMLLVGAVLLGFILGSCSSSASISLAPDLSGNAVIELRISDVLTWYYQDITGEYDIESIVQEEALARQFALRPGIDLVSFDDRGGGEITIGLAFDDVNRLVQAEAKNRDLLLVRREAASGGLERLSLEVNRETVSALLSLGPVSSNALSAYLLPSPGSEVDEDIYREDLIWALGDYADADELSRLIAASEISLIFALPRVPRSISGGRELGMEEVRRLGIAESSAVAFTLNIVELLALSTPEDFSVLY